MLLYVAGLVVLWGWAIAKVSAGLERDDVALVIVLPLAWTFSYFPMLGSLLLAVRMRSIQRVLADMHQRVRAGGRPTAEERKEIEETFTTLAASENGLPEFLVRPVVRRILRVLAAQARDGAGRSVAST